MNSVSQAIRDAAADLWHLHACFSGKFYRRDAFDALSDAERHTWESIAIRTNWHRGFAELQESIDTSPDSRAGEE